MNIIYFSLFSLLCLTLLVFFEKKVGKNAIFLFGIGSIINGSIFHLYSFPIQAFGITFGMDFLLQPIFFYCLYFMFKKDNAKSAKSMLIVSVLSLSFSASIQFLSSILSDGYTLAYLQEFIGFLFNIGAYFVSGYVFIYALNKLSSNKNSAILLLTLFLTNALNFGLFYFSRLIAFGLVNWLSFANFFVFNIILNLIFILLLKASTKTKDKQIK